MKRFLSLLLCSAVVLWGSVTALATEQGIIQSEADISSSGGALPSTCSESDLGCLVADAAVYVLNADFSVIPGGLLTGTLEHGTVFASDILRVIPDDEVLSLYTVTIPELKTLLEYGISHLVTDDADRIIVETSAFDDFPQVSGFTWTYDVSAPVGERVLRLSIDGCEMDLSDSSVSFTLAAPSGLLERAGLSPEIVSAGFHTIRSALMDYLESLDLLTAPSSRSTAVGTSNYPLIDRIPIVAIVAACILIALLAAIPRVKQKRYFSFEK